ncbi:MAG: prepilin peptidase [Candidatus Saccharimonadales bacterium]
MALYVVVFLFLSGLAAGSFAGAFAWRLHKGRDFVRERSECEHCHHKLSTIDLIPVVGWVLLRGKCRYCKKPVSWQYPVMELLLGLLFVTSYLFWPLGFEAWQAIALFVLWLVYIALLAALVVYDLKWMLLPDKIVLPLIALGFMDAALRTSLAQGGIVELANHIVLGVASLAGVYWLLYMVSKGRWVGFGDVKLSVFIGAVLGWQKSLLVLMLANLIGFLIIVPGLLSGKLTRTSRIPFGPFLIAAFFIAGLWGDEIIRWYIQTFIFSTV